MEGKLMFIIFTWLFFLICGGFMMLGVYLIWGRKKSDQGPRDSGTKSEKIMGAQQVR